MTPSKVFVSVFCCVVMRSSIALGAEATIVDRSFFSQVLREPRNFRIFLPSGYETSGKRYPVVYFFHGWSERHNRAPREGEGYDEGTGYGGDTIAAFVAASDLIVVKWDGYDPRKPGDDNPRPYNIGSVQTDRQFPLFFPELVRYIDANYRTIADREHRGASGLSMGGFMSYWIAGKYPDLLSSVSNFMGSSEFRVGPRAFPVEYRHDEMHNNYDGLRSRLTMGKRDFIQFYHRRMNLIWDYTREHHESEVFDHDHGTPGIAKTLLFHMRAFLDPLPRPPVWSYIDVYPEFSVWGWDVATDRKEPGFTVIENVSPSGLRSSVRRWLPTGPVLAGVRVAITSAPLGQPGKEMMVTTVRVRDGAISQARQKADSKGRLSFHVDGEPYEIGIGSEPVLALAGFSIERAAWATDGEPVHVLARFLNKGGRASAALRLRWETSNPGVRVETQTATLPPLQPGKFAEMPLRFTVGDPTREIVKLFAVAPGLRWPLEIPTFPPAEKVLDFKIADGGFLPVYQGAVTVTKLALGTGNGDGKASPGERVAVLLADGEAYRAAELFTNDSCVDLGQRASDGWGGYDNVGASAKYSLALIRSDCAPGHRVSVLARVQLPDKPNHRIRYARIEYQIQ